MGRPKHCEHAIFMQFPHSSAHMTRKTACRSWSLVLNSQFYSTERRKERCLREGYYQLGGVLLYTQPPVTSLWFGMNGETDITGVIDWIRAAMQNRRDREIEVAKEGLGRVRVCLV